jgi:VWFA-related protein
MTCRKLFIISFAIISLLSSLLLHAQKGQTYQYQRKVFLVELQVAVFDKDGKFVEVLKPEDFIILDERKQQEISHFDFVVHDKANIDLMSQGAPAQRRHFLLLFDLTFASKRGILNAREAAFEFIDMVMPTDLIAVATFSALRNQSLQVLVNFTNDKRQLKEVISTLGLIQAKHLIYDSIGYNFENLLGEEGLGGINPADDQDVSAALNDMFALMKGTATLTYKSLVANFIDQLKNLGAAINSMQGKKNIIYFSEGFDGKVLTGSSLKELDADTNAFLKGQFHAIDSEQRFGDAGIRINMEKMLNMLVGSDTVIQAIDIGGLRAEKAAGRFDETQTGQTTLFLMANSTGGVLYKNLNDFSKALDDILESTSKYYVIGYYPREVGKEGKFHRVKVKVNRPDLKVVTRKGYYEDKPYKEYSDLEKKMHLAEVVIKDIIHNDIQFTALASAFPGREKIAKVPIFLQFPGQQFLDKEWKKQGMLELFGYLINDEGYFKDFFNAEITIDRGKAEEKLTSHGIKFFDMLLAPPGKHKVKLIVRDSETGEMGSRICHIMVPDYQSKELAMTPPIFIDNDTDWLLSRGYDPNNPTGKKEGLPVSYPFIINDQEFIPAVVPELKIGQPAQFCLKVYNLMRHPQTKAPQSRMDFEIAYADGSFSKIQKISLVNKPTQGENNCFELLFNVIVDSHPPGNYQLKATVIDTLANKKAESSTPFILKP